MDIEGRSVAVSSVDPERAPLITRGFELYGSGQYTGQQTLDMVTAAGLVTRGTKGTPPKPLSLSRFYAMLSDRYYMGVVEYEGCEYPGRHEAIVTPELFDRVGRVLATRGGGGTRQRVHNHFLKGLLWCGRCGQRLIIMRGKGHGGTYFYFICRQQRQGPGCTQPYLQVEAMEAAVERHYATVALGDEFRSRVRGELDDALLGKLGGLDALRKRLRARLGVFEAKEDQYLELVGTPGWPKEKLRLKLDEIARERSEISEQLADTTTRLEVGREFFLSGSGPTARPAGFLQSGRYQFEAGHEQDHLH